MAKSSLRSNTNRLCRYFTSSNRSVTRQNSEGDLSSYLSSYRIRNISEADIPKIAELRKSLILHDCKSCLYSYHRLDPKGFLIAENDNGQIVGTHAMISYSKGLFISGYTYVHGDYRKNNLAMELGYQAISSHKNDLLILYAYQSYKGWVEFLAKHFRLKIGYTLKRYISTDDVDTHQLLDDLPKDVVIHPFDAGLLSAISAYDLQIADHERHRYLEMSCQEPNSKTLVAMKNGQCVGYGSVKLSCPGAKRIGPLYADDPRVAEALLKLLLRTFEEGKGVVMVVPSPNLDALKLANKLNFPRNETLHQLHDKEFPLGNVNKAFAHFDINSASI